MTIKPGTLCLIVSPHVFAGKTCTVKGRVPDHATVWMFDGSYVDPRSDEFYSVCVPDMPELATGGYWARRRELVPLAPPGDTDEVPTSITLSRGLRVTGIWIDGERVL